MYRIKVIKFFIDKTVLKVYFIEKEAKASLMFNDIRGVFFFFFRLKCISVPDRYLSLKAFVERKKTWTIIFHMTENMMRAE